MAVLPVAVFDIVGYFLSKRPLSFLKATMAQFGALRVVGPAEMAAADAAERDAEIQSRAALVANDQDMYSLNGYIRTQYDIMRNHRATTPAGWNHRLLAAQRAFNGTYDSTKLNQIRSMGGSDIYARVTATKCRGASALLRDVYLSPDRPWGLEPPDDPQIPDDILQSVHQLVQAEVSDLNQQGNTPSPEQLRDRISGLITSARDAAKKNAQRQAQISEDKIDTILKEGGFYKALSEFLTDLPLFPFACIKGPVVRIVPQIVWKNGVSTQINRPKLCWDRVSPFDLFMTPGVSDVENAQIIQKSSITRAELNDCLDLPGYNVDAVRGVLNDYGRGGLYDNWDTTDSERAVNENRENPNLNRSGMIAMLEFHGNVQGRMLLDYGMSSHQVPDELRDYLVQAWIIGRYVIKVQLSPSPRKRHPYFITSFEKVPGTPIGNALPDIIGDAQDTCNAALRALVNNMAMASGPQVVVNDDRVAPDADGEQIYPWKRWHVTSDPYVSNPRPPVEFFSPQSNSQELMQVYTAWSNLADELSGIPKYLQGSGATGGAGRTASGLAMLMGNASKILQTVAGNIDSDVFDPALTMLFDMIMLTDTSGLLTGEEQISVMGVSVAVQKETQRARQMEFLQATSNPLDIQIIGPKGRATVLRAVADGLGLQGAEIVPSDAELDAQQKASQAAAAAQGQPGHGGLGPQANQAQGNQPPQGGLVNGQVGPRTAIAGQMGPGGP